jgi:5-methyltetrahydrofolate--homocysteine methyltransferase
MLEKVIKNKWLKPSGIVAIVPAKRSNSCSEDIDLYQNEADLHNPEASPIFTWYGLRQQNPKAPGNPHRSLGDFIHPEHDYIGMFAVTSGDITEVEKQLNGDDYDIIMLKAIADRFAEAFAEYLHYYVRTELWGYAPSEKEKTFDNVALINEQYQGIRPAPGYPACPDHTVKKDMLEWLRSEEIDLHLTESFAMYPASSVSGFYFAHEDSQYFNINEIGEDQVKDYAKRRGASLEQASSWLASLMN